jgi:hypothetical protein
MWLIGVLTSAVVLASAVGVGLRLARRHEVEHRRWLP